MPTTGKTAPASFPNWSSDGVSEPAMADADEWKDVKVKLDKLVR